MDHYANLNRDIQPGSGYSDAWTRVLGRLGDYTATIVKHLQIVPTQVAMLAQTRSHILIRISLPGQHMVLRIAPETHLLREVFFGRTMNEQRIPAARIIYQDLRRKLVPFDYMLEGHVCGVGANQIDPGAPYLLHAAARQAGRTLRRMHRVHVAGWGYPSVSGRWMIPDWQSVLEREHDRLAPASSADLVFSGTEQTLVYAILQRLAAEWVTPVLLHGAPGPQAVRCTTGDHLQIEGWIDPGSVVAGDGLFDLAQGLDPTYPPAWSAGLFDGYVSGVALSPAEHERLRLLEVLTSYWKTCHYYMRAEPHEAAYARVQTLLADVRTPA